MATLWSTRAFPLGKWTYKYNKLTWLILTMKYVTIINYTTFFNYMFTKPLPVFCFMQVTKQKCQFYCQVIHSQKAFLAHNRPTAFNFQCWSIFKPKFVFKSLVTIIIFHFTSGTSFSCQISWIYSSIYL